MQILRDLKQLKHIVKFKDKKIKKNTFIELHYYNLLS